MEGRSVKCMRFGVKTKWEQQWIPWNWRDREELPFNRQLHTLTGTTRTSTSSILQVMLTSQSKLREPCESWMEPSLSCVESEEFSPKHLQSRDRWKDIMFLAWLSLTNWTDRERIIWKSWVIWETNSISMLLSFNFRLDWKMICPESLTSSTDRPSSLMAKMEKSWEEMRFLLNLKRWLKQNE